MDAESETRCGPAGDAAEADLVAWAKAGSQAAFSTIVVRRQALVRRFLAGLVGPVEAEDLTQETFVQAWETLENLKEPDKLGAWLCGVAWRKAMDWRRRLFRTRRRETAWSAGDLAGSEPWGRPAGQARAELAEALAQLPPRQRAALLLVLGAGFTHVEAAEVLKTPLGTLKSDISRGRQMLARFLGAAA